MLPTESSKPKIGVVGLGLIGGSIGLALRNPSREVLGYDIDAKSSSTALARQCIDRPARLEEIAACEVVFLAVPPGANITMATALDGFRVTANAVTDCCSVKTEIAAWASEGKHSYFIPGHPMAGHEKGGCEYASAWLFRGAKWLLTPDKKSLRSSVVAVEALIKEMGAQIVKLPPSEHDRLVATFSHLPHATAAALVLAAEDLPLWEVGAGSWRDGTRVGGVDPALWTQIFSENRSQLIGALEVYEKKLGEFKSFLLQDNPQGIKSWLARAEAAKRAHEPKAVPASKRK